MTPSFITPEWPAPAGVRAFATTRVGGVSLAPYESLNLGDHVGDRAEAVALNRRRLREAARLPAEPLWLRQAHGADVADADRGAPGGAADAAVTRAQGRVLAILTADCMPVLFAAADGAAVAAAHAGWRGLAAGVLEATVRALALPPPRLLAWIGPCIGASRYEVGAEVRAALLAADPAAAAAFAANSRGRYFADLAQLASRRLEKLGVGAVHRAPECTYSDANRYFSHRRDGRCGRQAALIWLDGANR
ncbi:MAG TPA: peptidoglycan editing factor PgeF [Steroidobacteraceae bacterium]|nr:peptidoglycan editing factor PgeF [Steroidobacteraceae bacterium]